MKTCRFIFRLVLGAVLICSIHFAYAGSFSDMVKGAQDILGSKGGLSNDEIIQGLKEALQVGTDRTLKFRFRNRCKKLKRF
jgi:hypothetical protein